MLTVKRVYVRTINLHGAQLYSMLIHSLKCISCTNLVVFQVICWDFSYHSRVSLDRNYVWKPSYTSANLLSWWLGRRWFAVRVHLVSPAFTSLLHYDIIRSWKGLNKKRWNISLLWFSSLVVEHLKWLVKKNWFSSCLFMTNPRCCESELHSNRTHLDVTDSTLKSHLYILQTL